MMWLGRVVLRRVEYASQRHETTAEVYGCYISDENGAIEE